MASKTVNIGTLRATLTVDDSDFKSAITRAFSTLNSFSKSLTSIGKTLTASITLPLAAIGGAAIKAAMNFESTFAKMQGLAGVAADQIDGLKQSVLGLAEEMGRPPQELAEALYFIQSSGFQGAEALDVLRTSAMAARAGLGTTAVVADMLTTVLNAYGHENITAADAVNSLTAAVRLGKGEPESFAAHLGYVVPIAAEMGVEFNEVAAAIAAMSRKMSSADVSTAVVNLRQVLADLLGPAKHTKDALDAWGTSAKEIRKVIREDGLLSALQFVNKQMKDNDEAFSDIFGNVRSLTGALSLAGVSAEGVALVFEDMKNNTNELNYAVGVVSNTTQDKLNRALSSLKVSTIELGTQLLPIFVELIGMLRDAAKWFTSLSSEGKKTVIMVAALAAALGPILTILGAIFSQTGLVVMAFAVLAAAFIYVYENWQAIVERVSDWTWWKNMMIDMTQFIIDYNPFTMLARVGILMLNYLSIKTTELFNNLIDIYNKLAKASSGKFPIISHFQAMVLPDPFTPVIEGLEALKSETTQYEHQFKGFTESLIDFAKKAGEAILGLFPKGMGGGMGGNGALPERSVTPTEAHVPVFEPKKHQTWFGDGPIRDTTKAVIDLATALKHSLQVAITDVMDAFTDLFSGKVNVTGFFQEILIAVADFVMNLGKQLILAAALSLAFKKLLLLNPGAAIAIGVAAIAAAAAFKGLLQKGLESSGKPQGLATGGMVTQGGVFQLHKNELVTLPNGSAVTPAGMATRGGGGSSGRISSSIHLRQLIIEIDKERERMNR